MSSSPSPLSVMQCNSLLAATFNCAKKKQTPVDPDISLPGAITPQILDALASVCVAESGETFAVSVDVLKDEIMLRVAGNGSVPEQVEEVEKHLGDIWQLLRKFNRDVAVSEPEKTPPLPQEDYTHRDDLFVAIYRFSMRKLMSRVKKYVPVVIPRLESLSSEHQWLEFDLTLKSLEALQLLPGNQVESQKDESVADIIALFGYLQEKLNPVVEQAVQQKERVRLDPDADDVQPPIPLRAIQKLLALHQHVTTLSRIPRSPKRKHILEKKLVIKRLETEPIPYTLDLSNLSPTALYPHLFPPTTSKSVPKTEVVETEVVETEVVGTKVVETLSDVQAKAIKMLVPRDGKLISHVHPECAVLLDVRKDARIVHRSYYIGVSKLSCLSCKLFFAAFNQKCTMRFYTRGCHGKIYANWADPCSLSWGIEDDSRRDATRSQLNEELLRTLVTALKASGHSRGGSDSSIASHTSDAPHPTREVTGIIDGIMARYKNI